MTKDCRNEIDGCGTGPDDESIVESLIELGSLPKRNTKRTVQLKYGAMTESGLRCLF